MNLYSLLIFIVAGIFLGLPTGPSRFFVVGASLKKGRKAAFNVYLGILGALLIYAALAMLASGFLSSNPKVENISYLVGSILMVIWGGYILFKGKTDGGASIDVGGGSLSRKGFITALSSPVTPFIYLTMIQVLKMITDNISPWMIVLHLIIAEICSGLSIFTIAYLAGKREEKLNSNWKTAKIIMGFFLICLGLLNLYQLLEVEENEIKIDKKDNLLEEQIEKDLQ